MISDNFSSLLQERILVLDGAIGTMIQGYGLDEADFRGERFASWPSDLRGNNDLLVLTRPDIVTDISRRYIDAGADIVSTDTFNANAISMEDYGMSHLVSEINREAARLLRELVDRYKIEENRKIWVAGSIGPTNKTASMSPDVNDPSYRAVGYDDLFDAYFTQIKALMDGGVDILLFETIFDTLNLKAGLDAAVSVMDALGRECPVMLSMTLSGRDGRTFSGQTIPAFLASVEHAPVASIGINCSFGAADMLPALRELAKYAPYPVSCHPNAGLPDAMGRYTETPDAMADHIRGFVDEGLVNIVGGCCGTTPAHIEAIKAVVKERRPHSVSTLSAGLHLSGLERLDVTDGSLFVNVGERCNVAGSRKFLRLIKEGKYDEALSIARRQVDDGAQVIDINMDDGMMDARSEMCGFLNLIASEPDIARVPVMIDSSDFEVIEAALKCVQGKGIVNSISLKEGEEAFLTRASRIKKLGAAVVVMAFDERGQADVFERKIEVCGRAYRLLTENVGFSPEDIIFDPNILAIATGMKEHDRYGADFIMAVEWIKSNCPGAKVSGGVSNLSFSFRGNNYLREAIHAVFLYHAIAKGMDMGIVNPSSSVVYDDIDPVLRSLIEDVVLYRRDGASDELIAMAQKMLEDKSVSSGSGVDGRSTDGWRTLSVDQRLEHALVKGIHDYLEQDIAEALAGTSSPVRIIDGPLMRGMDHVGRLFGEGKMFLPQVVKTARTMKRAVEILKPALESANGGSVSAKAGKVVFATVKGDVHDIGKNIVSIVLSCNNYEVIDLGVMVPAEEIVRAAIDEKPDFVCLSGLITPSLDEMVRVVKMMEKVGLRIPVMVGGATTSRLHTAVKIAPNYSGVVVHVPDASQNPLIAARLLDPLTSEEFVSTIKKEYTALRDKEVKHDISKLSLVEARSRSVRYNLGDYHPVAPRCPGRTMVDVGVNELIPYINWRFFFNAWKLSGDYVSVTQLHDCPACHKQWIERHTPDDPAKGEEVIKLYRDASRMLSRMSAGGVVCRAVVDIEPGCSEGDDIVVGDVRIPTLRSQSVCVGAPSRSLADYVLESGDYIGAFAVTVDMGDFGLRDASDSYATLLIQSLSHRLAEAASEWLHEKVRREIWGYAPEEDLDTRALFHARYKGIRPAVGYPSLPDQKLTFIIDGLLGFDSIGIRLTENGAMEPSASVCGLYIAHPDASYFMVGSVFDDQIDDYALRRGISSDEVKRLLAL